MNGIDTKIIFAILGPLFLMLALWRTLQAGKVGPQSRTWWIVGTVFSLVALWLWTRT